MTPLEETTRAILALALNSDDPLMPSIGLGDCVSALDAVQAAAFVSACEDHLAGLLEADCADGVTRLRYTA